MSIKVIYRFLRLACAAALCTALTLPTVYAQRKQKPRKPQPTSTTNATGADAKNSEQRPQAQEVKAGAESRQINSAITIRWRGQPGVERYRLQVARDAAFDDIIFDQAVTGRQHTVKLPSGNYYWRVAPAVGETGTYTTPQPVEIAETPSVVDEKSVVTAQDSGGWRTATGEMPRLVAAPLRAGTGLDLVGVNTDGTVYAIDGTHGVALWTARYNPSAKRGEESGSKGVLFTPLIIGASDARKDVVVAFSAGLRALRGETGGELWRAAFPGRALAGTVADVDGDGKQEIVAVASDPSSLVVLSAETGKVISNTNLEAQPIGAPALLVNGEERGVVLALGNGDVEFRRANGERVRSVKLEGELTTAPLVVSSPLALVVVIGMEKGLVALTAADLRQIGLINTAGDTPRGILTAADVDGDGSSEIVMLTRGGRVALIGTADGKIRWVAEGAKDADSAALADLNGDGVLDVIAAAGPSFAHGYSGKDGSLIWRVAEEVGGRAPVQPSAPMPRALVIAVSSTQGAFLVGSDTSRVGLRAVELPKGAVKTAVR